MSLAAWFALAFAALFVFMTIIAYIGG
jgi:hypothetical protein